jgi:predicted ATPase/DNA-binding CsgD family transcriptional regulator
MQAQQRTEAQAGTGYLPVQPTPFVGRREELESVAKLLATPGCRLVTLVGTGGIGKTRLALKVAARAREEHADGVYLVELAALSDPALVAQAVASVLGLRDEAERSALEMLSAALKDKRLLLVLDNCEHLLDACAGLAHGLLTACPALTILATSREPLRTAGEVIWEVPPLSLPVLEQLSPPNELLAVDSVSLFVDRARRALPTFELTTQNSPLVARLCHRLDGLPLAIELAAARIRVLSVAQIYDRLDDALRLLAGGDRLAPARQQTLRATLDWSYDLLTTDEKRLFQRLSVFAGTFGLEAIEEVCSGDGLERAGILELLGGLVEKSLVVAERSEGETRRFRLLETIGWYAGERLVAAGEAGKWRDRHLGRYLRFAEQVDPKESWGVPDAQVLERFDLERDNLRGAMRRAVENSRVDESHRLAASMAWFWHRRGNLREGLYWLDQILAIPGQAAPEASVGALSAAGFLAGLQGDYPRSIALHQEAVTLGRDSKCLALAGWSLHKLAWYADRDGDIELAGDRLAESLDMFLEIGHEGGVAHTLIFQGLHALRWGEHERGEALIRVSLPFLRGTGDTPGFSNAHRGLAAVARQRGEMGAAIAHLQEALRLARESVSTVDLLLCLEDLAGVASAQALPERAARLLGASEALRRTIGSVFLSREQSDIDQDILITRARLGEPAFEAAFAAGQEMSLEQAVAFALQDIDGGRAAGEGHGTDDGPRTLTPLQAEKRKYGGLTARERQVAALVAGGKSNREIAEELVVTVRTVEAHVTHILRKLGFDSRTQVAGWAIDRGLARPPKTLEEQMRGPSDT